MNVYSMASGKREIIAETHQTSGGTAEAIAEFIVRAINDIDKREHPIKEMAEALEICLECEGLNWSAEHDAEVVLPHAKMRA
jgi:hypothetical protein